MNHLFRSISSVINHQFFASTQAAMIPSEKFHLKWNVFHENMATSFKDLRQEGDFTYVTLACEGNQQLQAHKLILSSSSPFFKNILRSYKSAEPLIYLRQVSFQDLASVVDFMYYGQADVKEENLNSFLALSEEFELKGLARHDKTDEFDQFNGQNKIKETANISLKVKVSDFEQPSIGQNTLIKSKRSKEVVTKEEDFYEEFNDTQQEIFSDVIDNSEVSNNTNMTIKALNHTIETTIEKQDNAWCCNKCGKQSSNKANMKKHAEVHIKGIIIIIYFLWTKITLATGSGISCAPVGRSWLHRGRSFS